MKDRRMATRPYYKKSLEQDRLTAIVAIAFLTGVFLGATIALGWIELTG